VELEARYAGCTSRLVLGRGLNENLARVVGAYTGPRLLLSESQVARARQEQLEDLMERVEVDRLMLRAGEEGKSSVSLLAVLAELHALGAERGSPLLAFGGGMVGDLGGLAASLWKRGMPLILAPTSLLAMVDACVGGKTAINFGGERNVVGTFWPAQWVVVDLDALATLPRRQWVSGFGELLKTAWLGDATWAEELEASVGDMLRADHPRLHAHVERALCFKIAITERDEHEAGERALLNLGHTLAHVLETREEVELAHGEAVLLGMLAAVLVARETGTCGPGEAGAMEAALLRVLQHLDMARIPGVADLPLDEVLNAMARDKKVRRGRLHMVLPCRRGAAHVVDVELPLLRRALDGWKERVA